MTRMSKQGKKRAVSPRKSKKPSEKTGPKKDHFIHGYKAHENAVEDTLSVFIGKIKE